MFKLLRFITITCGLLLILLSAALTFSRAGSEGAYWLLSYFPVYGGVDYQAAGQYEQHPIRGFDSSTIFDHWSPDKKWLYFHTTDQHYDVTHSASSLYRMRFGSIRPECLGTMIYPTSMYPVAKFSLSPDFQWVAYASPDDAPNGLYITQGGCQKTEPIYRPGDQEIIDSLFWSPDGEWLYFHTHHETLTQSHLYRIRPDGSNAAILTRTFVSPAETSKNWQWSPDGEWILLTACNPRRCFQYSIAADGSSTTIIENFLSDVRRAVWSANGQWIFYSARGLEQSEDDIFRIRPDGSEVEQLTQLPGYESIYAISPDGDWILFDNAYEDVTYRYAMRSDGSEQYVVYEDEYSFPNNTSHVVEMIGDWIYIAFLNRDDVNASTLYRVRLGGSEKQTLVTGRFATYPWVMSPGGQYMMTVYGGLYDERMDSEATFFRMRLDGSEKQRFLIDRYYMPVASSPLFNLPFRAWIVFLVGAGMLALGIASGLARNHKTS